MWMEWNLFGLYFALSCVVHLLSEYRESLPYVVRNDTCTMCRNHAKRMERWKRFLARAKYKLLNPFNAVQDGLWERVSVCVCAHMRVNMVSIPMKRCVVCHKNVHATILSVFTQECNARASQLFVCWKEEKKYENKKPTQARYIDLNCYGDETHSISSISRIVLTFVTVITKLINSIDKIVSRSLWRASDGSSFSRDWTTFFFS